MDAQPILLCSDLDRTLLPNGPQPESPAARPLLRALAQRPEVTLVYVSGRDKGLLQAAVEEYDIPVPDYAIGDVGTTIYAVRDGDWQSWAAWSDAIGGDWNGLGNPALVQLLQDIPGIRLQEAQKQNTHKLSYYAPADRDPTALLRSVRERLHPAGVRANLVWSVDETSATGLLDVLPESASKLHAVQFLMLHKGFPVARTVFAGDSGNDLPVLVSPLQAVLVANATDQVRREATALAAAGGQSEKLYQARGGLLGMNGNYSAGVLEGLAHYLPECAAWLEAAAGTLSTHR